MKTLLNSSVKSNEDMIEEISSQDLELISGGHDGEHKVTKKDKDGGTEYTIDAA